MSKKPLAPYSILPIYGAVDLCDMIAPHQRVLSKFGLFNPGMCVIKDELHLVVRNGINMNNPAHRTMVYESALQRVVLDARTLKVRRLPNNNDVTVDGHPAVVHDVRISQSRIMTACVRKRGSGTSVFYEPVMGFYKEDGPLEFSPIFHNFDGPNHKNWTHIIDDWFDFGSCHDASKANWPYHAIGRVKDILGDETVMKEDTKKSELWGHRGGAPPVMINPGLFLGSGHHKHGDAYYHTFWLMLHPEKIKPNNSTAFSISESFRLGYHNIHDIQFLTGLVDDPFNNEMMIVSYGTDDEHAVVGRIRKVDVYGLMA